MAVDWCDCSFHMTSGGVFQNKTRLCFFIFFLRKRQEYCQAPTNLQIIGISTCFYWFGDPVASRASLNEDDLFGIVTMSSFLMCVKAYLNFTVIVAGTCIWGHRYASIFSCPVIAAAISRLQVSVLSERLFFLLSVPSSVPKLLVDLHVKLLRKIGKSVSADRWEKHLVKVNKGSYFNQSWTCW